MKRKVTLWFSRGEGYMTPCLPPTHNLTSRNYVQICIINDIFKKRCTKSFTSCDRKLGMFAT